MTCNVLRCQQPATTEFVLKEDGLLESVVCAKHYAELDGGAHWMLDADSGILMGSDIPPKLVEYSTNSLLSSEPGICLELQLETPDGPRTQSVWLSTDEADRLGEFLTNRIFR